MFFPSFENLRIYINAQYNSFQSFCQHKLASLLQYLQKISSFLNNSYKNFLLFLASKPDKVYLLQKFPIISPESENFWLKKVPCNEELSLQLENLLNQKKINEFLAILKEKKDLTDIKSFVFSLLFEILLELSNVTIAFEAMKILITSNCTHLNKKIIKIFFNICLKLRQSSLAVYLFQFYESQQRSSEDSTSFDLSSELEKGPFELEEKMSISFSPISQNSEEYQAKSKEFGIRAEKNSNPNSLHFLMNYYFILNIEKLGEMDMAIRQTEQFLSSINCNSENSKIIHKIFEELLKGCIMKPQLPLNYAFQLLNLLKILTIKPNDIFFNKLIDFASKNDCLDLAELILENMLQMDISPTIVTYNTLIYSYFKHNIPRKAWAIFEQLKVSNNKPDNFTYTTMINGIKNSEGFDLLLAFQLFEEYKQFNRPDQIIYNCLLDACINSCNFEKAREILLEIKRERPENQCDEITYNTLIKGCCKSKQLTEAIGFFEEMKMAKINPNRITYNSLIDTCVKTNKMNIAWKFFDEMLKNEIDPDNFTYSILINGIKSNNTNKEELIKTINLLENLEKIGGHFNPDEILYNSLIDACVKFNEINKALCLFEEMKKKNIDPSAITYGILIKAFGKMNDLVKAFKIFEQIKLNNLKINDVTYGCLLDACVKNNRIDLALVLFEKIKQDNITLNTILYTTLIKGFSKANKLNEALEIFDLMKKNPKTYPNIITYNCILDACVKTKAFEKALSLFSEMKKILSPDLITYSTMIKGFSKTGDLKVSMDLFYEMIDKKIIPDDPLINLLLEACFCNKNCEMGIKIYEILSNFKVKFTPISFGIIIKLLGQGKRFNQAMSILPQMKQKNIKPGVIIYTNLLQICFQMRKIDRAVFLYEKMQEENVQLDHVCYTKLINGALNCGKVELANSFYEKSIVDKIVLNVHVYKSLYEEIKISKIVEKNKLLSVLEKQIENFNVSVETINSSNGYLKEKNPNFIKPQEFKVNRKIPFENQENYHKSFEKNNIIEEKRNNYNKENKDNFNFRNKVESQTKTGENHDFDIRKKNRNPMLILSPKELGKMVSPKNL